MKFTFDKNRLMLFVVVVFFFSCIHYSIGVICKHVVGWLPVSLV